MNTTDRLAAALSALLSLNRTQGVTDEQYEAAEREGDEALAQYEADKGDPLGLTCGRCGSKPESRDETCPACTLPDGQPRLVPIGYTTDRDGSIVKGSVYD